MAIYTGLSSDIFSGLPSDILASGLPTSTDTSVLTWINAGGTQSQAVANIVTAMVAGFKTDGSWNTIDDVILHALDTRSGSRIWIKSLTVLTEVNTPSWAQFVGYTGDGSTTSLNYNINPSTLTNYVQNSGHMGVYVPTVDSRNAFHNYAGSASAANTGPNVGRATGGNAWCDVNHNTNSALTGGAGTTTGYISGERTSSSRVDLYVNSDSSTANNSGSTSAAITSQNLFGLAQNLSGSAANFTNGVLAATLIGASLLQALGVRSRVTTAVTALIAL